MITVTHIIRRSIYLGYRLAWNRVWHAVSCTSGSGSIDGTSDGCDARCQLWTGRPSLRVVLLGDLLPYSMCSVLGTKAQLGACFVNLASQIVVGAVV